MEPKKRTPVFLICACAIAVIGTLFVFFKKADNNLRVNPYQNDVEEIQKRNSEKSPSRIKVLEIGHFSNGGGGYLIPYTIFQDVETKRVYMLSGSFIKELSKEEVK